MGAELVEPAELGLSARLTNRLPSWLDRIPRWDSDIALDPNWLHEGLTLAYDLQHELGPDVTVLYRASRSASIMDRRTFP